MAELSRAQHWIIAVVTVVVAPVVLWVDTPPWLSWVGYVFMAYWAYRLGAWLWHRWRRSGRDASDSAVIEILELNGGPCHGERRDGVKPVEMLRVRTPAGHTELYRRSEVCHQVRGAAMAQPYSRTWTYEWVPAPAPDTGRQIG